MDTFSLKLTERPIVRDLMLIRGLYVNLECYSYVNCSRRACRPLSSASLSNGSVEDFEMSFDRISISG